MPLPSTYARLNLTHPPQRILADKNTLQTYHIGDRTSPSAGATRRRLPVVVLRAPYGDKAVRVGQTGENTD